MRRSVVKIGRIVSTAVAVVAAVLAVAALLFLLRPVRERLLDYAISVGDGALPGTLTVERASWPSPGTLRAERAAWTDGPDTLAALERLQVSVDLSDLLSRDLHLRRLSLLGIRADIDAVLAAFGGDGRPGDPADDGGGGFFPREGSVPGLPSIAVDGIALTAHRIEAPGGLDMRDLTLSAAVEARSGRRPSVAVSTLRIKTTGTPLSVDSLTLSFDPASSVLEADGALRLPRSRAAWLRASSAGDGSFTFSLARSPESAPPRAAGIEITGRLFIDDRKLDSATFSAAFLTPSVSDLMDFEMLEGPLRHIGDLEGVSGGIEGRAGFSPFEASGRLDIGRASWMDTLHLAGAYGAGGAVLDTMFLEMPGLRLGAAGSLPPGAVDLSATIRVNGAAWLEKIVPGSNAPEDIAADISLTAGEVESARNIRIEARGSASAAGVSIDTIDVRAVMPREDGPYRVDLLAGRSDAVLRTTAVIDAGERIDVKLSRPDGDAPGIEEIVLSGGIGWNAAARRLDIEDLRAEGAVGEWRIEGSVDSLRRSRFDISAFWPVPPRMLERVVDAGGDAWEEFVAGWSRQGPFSLRASGSFEPGAAVPRLDASASLLLPGPDLLAPLLLPGFPAEDLGPLAIDLSAASTTSGGSGALELGIDASRTGWLQTALAGGAIRADGMRIDTAAVCFEGVELRARGSAAGGSLDLEADFALVDSGAVRRLERMTGRRLSMTARGSASIAGSRDSPAVSAGLSGSFATPGLSAPDISMRGEYGDRGLVVSLGARNGLEAGPVALDSLAASWESVGDGPGIVPGRGRIEATGKDASLMMLLGYDRIGRAHTVTVDTMHAGICGETLSSLRPFIVSSRADTFSVEGMTIEGKAGRVEADGHVSANSADLGVRIGLSMPHKPRCVRIAERLWPGKIEARARLTGIWTGSLEGSIGRLTLSDGTSADIRLSANADSTRASFSASFLSPKDTLLAARASLPPATAGSPEARDLIDARVEFDGMPVPLGLAGMRDESPDEAGLLTGAIDIGGSFGEPTLAADLECLLTGGTDLSLYRLLIRGRYPDSADVDVVSATMRLEKSSRSVVRGKLFFPARLTVGAPWFVSGDDPMSLRIVSRGLELSDLEPILPPDIDIGGTFEAELGLEGDSRDPAIDGFFRTGNLSAGLADRARASIEADLLFGGSLSGPSVDGRLTVVNALVRMPEPSPELLPAEGDAVLWEAADSAFAAADTSGGGEGMSDAAERRPGAFEDVRFDVTVSIPGGFRIEGERISLELRGELRVAQSEDRPVLTGRLEPVRGRLLFMGRYFQISAGNVIFYGEDELQPSFDLSLTATIDEVEITIRLTGTAEEPEIDISSEPPMDESDIMSLLLFGQRMDALDDSQTNLLQRRTTEVLAAFGAARLEQSLSKRLGVDMVTFQQSTRQPDQAALMLGKYLNRRTLLKFEQGIEDTANFLINLEYFITANLKVKTSIDQSEETGIELNWTTEY